MIQPRTGEMRSVTSDVMFKAAHCPFQILRSNLSIFPDQTKLENV